MSKQKPKPKGDDEKRKRNVIFVTLDDETEAALQKFLSKCRIPPERSAVGFAALVEFLKQEGCLPAIVAPSKP